ncbi:MAG: TetR family transcriptional regulator [Chloroflexi bacterium]|nr:TetR family transcriptional regulator [Chloroflexota bacterium]
MNGQKADRRVERTKQLLYKALMELSSERGYYNVSVREIAERANVGRTTFYAHFASKEALLIQAHFEEVGDLVPLVFTREELLAETAPERLVTMFERMQQTRPFFFELIQGADMTLFQREVRGRYAARMENSLRTVFDHQPCALPWQMLANYLASAQMGFVYWWVESHAPYDAREMAQAYQRIQRAILRDAFGLD